VPEATIDVGHSALLKELAELFPERTRRELMNQIRLRDKNRLTKLLEEMEKPEEKDRVKVLIDLLETTSIGEAASITSNIKELKQYSSELEEIADWLKELGVADGIGFDITLIRNLEYYTGLIFEVITPSIGVPIGGGGRYDNLMEKFGAPATKAIGFALDMDKVSRATGLTPPKKVRALILGDPRIAYRIGRELRGKGIPAAVNWGQDGENLLGFAETWGYTHIVKAESVEEASILKLGKDGWTKLSVREIPDEISQATGDS
jgi:histidyl-tRNA synthetase